jgi:hypothetical protein
MKKEDILTDVFEGDFPPLSYGTTLEEIEKTTQEVVEKIFRDQDGLILSSVNAVTMKPYRLEEIKDRPEGKGTFVERSAIPQAIKPLFMNYENTGQASGTYLDALCAKYQVTGSPEVREFARRTVEGIVAIWKNGAEIEHSLGGGGLGWFPKPYDGLRSFKGMHECSVDQYCEVTLGLQQYYRVMADEDEKRTIEEMIVSFADWWYDHNFTGIYLGEAVWWKRLETHSMAASYFLYLFTLAQSWSPCRKFQHGFEIWQELKGALKPPGEAIWGCMNGLTVNVLERLNEMRPDLSDFWISVARHQAPLLKSSVVERVNMNRRYEFEGFGADYLCAVDHLLPEQGFADLAIKCLNDCNSRNRFYHLRRGLKTMDLDSRERGDDFRDAYQSELHVHWLSGYWKLSLKGRLN